MLQNEIVIFIRFYGLTCFVFGFGRQISATSFRVLCLRFGVPVDRLSSVGLLHFILLYSCCMAILLIVAVGLHCCSVFIAPVPRYIVGLTIQLWRWGRAGLCTCVGFCLPVSVTNAITPSARVYQKLQWTPMVISLVIYVVVGHVTLRTQDKADDGGSDDAIVSVICFLRFGEIFMFFPTPFCTE